MEQVLQSHLGSQAEPCFPRDSPFSAGAGRLRWGHGFHRGVVEVVMNWSNVRLILGREIRDQLRDRRTLFMIAVLPVLLYPLLAMSFFQASQFLREHDVPVLVIGAPELADLPPLIEDGQFAAKLLPHRMLRLTLRPPLAASGASASDASADDIATPDPVAEARRELQQGNYEVVVVFPSGFSDQLADFRASILHHGDPDHGSGLPRIPKIEIFPNLAKDSSRIAYQLVANVLDRWCDQLGARNLADSRIAPVAARPFDLATQDLAPSGQHAAMLWSKILPLVLVLWALTGAFCPAIDLCAGERERGTLETLLCSPAERCEIVWGKLLTVSLISMATALVNLASLGVTGAIVLRHFPDLGAPPVATFAWLVVALVPISILFAALCLALAAFARSTKEGHYYLMPLLLVAMPLSILSMAPQIGLTVGASLIPVTGMILLLRAALEGEYAVALLYSPVVASVTLACCWLAIHWAIRQFSSESVLFRDGERWNLWLWLKHVVRERGPRSSVGAALFCGLVIVTLRFLLSFCLPTPESLRDLELLAVATQLFVVALPALLLTKLLARSPRQTLSLRLPPLRTSLAAVLLAIVIHPAIDVLQTVVMRIYPLDNRLAQELSRMFSAGNDLGILLLVLCLLPALCEELAFRGFILSGLNSTGRTRMAIVVSSIFFAATHAVLQQSLIAGALGIVLGYLAIQSGSVLPGMLFHAVHNALGVCLQQASPAAGSRWYWVEWSLRDVADEGLAYRWPLFVVSVLASGLILARLQRSRRSIAPRFAAPAYQSLA
jgi:sodium transport system permease protein